MIKILEATVAFVKNVSCGNDRIASTKYVFSIHLRTSIFSFLDENRKLSGTIIAERPSVSNACKVRTINRLYFPLICPSSSGSGGSYTLLFSGTGSFVKDGLASTISYRFSRRFVRKFSSPVLTSIFARIKRI